MSRAGSGYSFVKGFAETNVSEGDYYDEEGESRDPTRDEIHKHVTSTTLKRYIVWWGQCERVLTNLSPHKRRRHFDMSDFGYKTECGTVACAAGYCGFDPWFRKRGFQMVWEKDFLGFGKFKLNRSPEPFFGEDGCNAIFFDTTKRPVSTVIKEVQNHIKGLKAQLADRDKWTRERLTKQ